ncbi:MAG TPA: tetratricopeptide repeat protein [Terriglobales bacterium]|nr:tetratricopeptide repeat protein [Terriglobales bacterium]
MQSLKIAAIASCLLLFTGCSSLLGRNAAFYVQRGNGYRQQGKTEAASIEYRKALQKDPHYADAFLGLARADLALGNPSAAYLALRDGVTADPQRSDIQLALGQLELAANDPTHAQAEADAVLAREPNNIAALQLRGAALLGRHQGPAAEAVFSRLVALQPKDPAARVNLAVLQIGRGDRAAGEQSLLQATALDPGFAPATMNLAKLYQVENNPRAADAVFQRATAASPKNASLFVAWANLRRDRRDLAGGDQVLATLRHNDSSAESAVAIGRVYVSWGEVEKALGEFQRAGVPGARDAVAADLALGRWSEAARINAALLRASSVAPADHVIDRIADARILAASGKVDAATSALRQIVSDAPTSAAAHAALAAAYEQNGQTAAAQGEYEQALSHAGSAEDAPAVLAAVAQFDLRQGNIREALAASGRWASLQPGSAASHLSLGAALLAGHAVAPATLQFQAALVLAPHDATVYQRLADADVASHNVAAAERDLETALSLAPGDAAPLAQLADLESGNGQRTQAIARVSQFVAAHPLNASGHQILGALEIQAGDRARGEQDLQRSLQLDQTLVLSYLQLGRAYQDDHRDADAIATYRQALLHKPNFPPLVTLIGNLYLSQGNYTQAAAYFQRALDQDPNFGVAAANLAWIDLQTNANPALALGLAQRAKQLLPNVDSVSDTLAVAYTRNGAAANAIPLLRQCIAREPKVALYRVHLSQALAAGHAAGAVSMR